MPTRNGQHGMVAQVAVVPEDRYRVGGDPSWHQWILPGQRQIGVGSCFRRVRLTRRGLLEKRSRGVAKSRIPLFPWFASSAPVVFGIASGGSAAVLSIAVGIAAPCLAAIATGRPRYSYAPSLCFTLLFVAVVGVLCFNSAAFVIDSGRRWSWP